MVLLSVLPEIGQRRPVMRREVNEAPNQLTIP